MTSFKRTFLRSIPWALSLIVLVFVAAPLPATAHDKTEISQTAPAGAETELQAPQPPRPGADEKRAREYFTDLPLLTQSGESVAFYSDILKDRVVLINFVYTNCEDACPLMTQMLLQVRDRLGDLFDNPVRFVSISTDPERDTPGALAEFARQQKADDPGWVFLTGEKENIDFILKRLGQYSPNFESHSTLLLAGNVRTRHWMKVPPMTPVPAIVVRLQTLVGES